MEVVANRRGAVFALGCRLKIPPAFVNSFRALPPFGKPQGFLKQGVVDIKEFITEMC